MNRPAWLTRMENGNIGEARTKAFLLDKFWVLERSVDIHGADFIIQQRLTSRNILDVNPPRLGVIQVKFYQDEKTAQYVHKEYVLNNEGEPREEFFLMIHTGNEDSARRFLISAKEIADNFEIAGCEKVNADHYYLPGNRIINNDRFEVKLVELALKQIDIALTLADFKQNRRFLSWFLPSVDIDPTHIEYEYTIDLDNSWGDISQEIYKIKKSIQSRIYDMEEVTIQLNEVLRETNPEKILETLETLYLSHGEKFKFPNDYYDQDMHYTVLEHKRKIHNLKTEGILDAYLIIFKELGNYICSDLVSEMKLDNEKAYILEIRYNSKNLKEYFFSSRIIDYHELVTDEIAGVLTSEPGRIEAFWVPGRYGFGVCKNYDSREQWIVALKNNLWALRRPIMEEMYNKRFDLEVVF